jgi:SpoVK/Ycf46/Vps4 family AAA+-type ATPase
MTEIDGVHTSATTSLFVLGATNRPDLVDTSLLRPGRFDQLVRIGSPDTHAKQAAV